MNENTTNMKEGAAGGGSWWYWCEGATTSSNSNSSSGSDTEVWGNSVLAGHEEDLHEVMEYSGGWFRGIARALGSNRPLAFVSEGAVAGQRMMPKWLYYSAWGVSGVAIAGDIATRTWDAPPHKQQATAFYWTFFHLPASLVVPAVIIHQVVHTVDSAMMIHPDKPLALSPSSLSTAQNVATTSNNKNPSSSSSTGSSSSSSSNNNNNSSSSSSSSNSSSSSSSSSNVKQKPTIKTTPASSFVASCVKRIPVRYRPFVPVLAAGLSIIPVVPAVDYCAETILEPTLGNYLELEFHHPH